MHITIVTLLDGLSTAHANGSLFARRMNDTLDYLSLSATSL